MGGVKKTTTVGKSGRTPCKHKLTCGTFGSEIAVANSPKLYDVERLVWKDLAAGDGAVEEGQEWKRNCSPGILAYYASETSRHGGKPVDVTLYEKDIGTYDALLANLTLMMPTLGYAQLGPSTWRCGVVKYRALFGSGHDVSVDDLTRRDAVLISNDPNKITDWAMRPTLIDEIQARGVTRLRTISTMGCNVRGLKRLTAEERAQWYELLRSHERVLQRHHDLYLTRIEKDDAQWAYLLSEPVAWRESGKTIANVNRAFTKAGFVMDGAWYRTQSDEYARIKDYLFMTKRERGE